MLEWAEVENPREPAGSGRAIIETVKRSLPKEEINATGYGFRSSLRDWAAEQTNAPHAAMEAALAHTMRNKV